MKLCDIIAANDHEVWSQSRIAEGWTYGPELDSSEKENPDLVPYDELDENEKDYNRSSAEQIVKMILYLGYGIYKEPNMRCINWTYTKRQCFSPNTYTPNPFPTTSIKLVATMLDLADLIAENNHDVWAKAKIKNGWRYSPLRNDENKQHNLLVPYLFLSEAEKKYDREAAIETLKLMIGLGFRFKIGVSALDDSIIYILLKYFINFIYL